MRQIVDFAWRTSDTWITWKAGGVDEALAALEAEDLPVGPRDGLALAITTLDEQMREREPAPAIAGGIWIPTPLTGRPTGQVVAELVVPESPRDLEPKRYRKSVRRPPKIQGERSDYYDSAIGPTPAGPMVSVVSHQVEPDGAMRYEFIQTYLPPGAAEAVRLTFTTYVVAEFFAMGDESLTIQDDLKIELGPDDGA